MDLNHLCNQVIALAREAGDFLVTESSTFKSHFVETKGLNDFVSYVDKESERMIVEKLREILPGSGFIAEEGTGEPVEGGYNWIIDPLDGTTNFVHGIPFYAVSIALSGPDGELLVGVVHEPNHGECFHAYKGGGAHLNGAPIEVSHADTLSRGLLATGFPYTDFKHMRQYMRSLRELMQRCHGLRRIGSAALDLSYVACGRFEAFFEYNLNPWDVAAGTLLVREAGGKATTFQNGSDCVFGREMIAAGDIHPELLEIVYRHFYGDAS
jgi:myo-inositol-1(or 4)-monophosphatase